MRTKLFDIVEKYPSIWENPRKLRKVLLDYYPADTLIRNTLMMCVEEHIPHEIHMLKSCDAADRTRYIARLSANFGCRQTVAEEAVALWESAILSSGQTAGKGSEAGPENVQVISYTDEPAAEQAIEPASTPNIEPEKKPEIEPEIEQGNQSEKDAEKKPEKDPEKAPESNSDQETSAGNQNDTRDYFEEAVNELNTFLEKKVDEIVKGIEPLFKFLTPEDEKSDDDKSDNENFQDANSKR